MADKETMRIKAQFKKATKEPSEYVVYAMSDKLNEWYLLLRNIAGDDDAFAGGQYLVRMLYKGVDQPPEFYFITPNGLYDTEKKVCVSIGEYHKDQYRAVLGMSGFADNLVSGMIGWKTMGGGISIMSTSAADKKSLAKKSVEYNEVKHKKIMDTLRAQFSEYSKLWAWDKVVPSAKERLLVLGAKPLAA